MPDLRNCIRHEGKVYCWDSTDKKMVEIKITDVPIDKIPKEVLIALLDRANK